MHHHTPPNAPKTATATNNKKSFTSKKDNCHHDKECILESKYRSLLVIRTRSTIFAASCAGSGALLFRICLCAFKAFVCKAAK